MAYIIEADVFLAERSPDNLLRNELVSSKDFSSSICPSCLTSTDS